MPISAATPPTQWTIVDPAKSWNGAPVSASSEIVNHQITGIIRKLSLVPIASLDLKKPEDE